MEVGWNRAAVFPQDGVERRHCIGVQFGLGTVNLGRLHELPPDVQQHLPGQHRCPASLRQVGDGSLPKSGKTLREIDGRIASSVKLLLLVEVVHEVKLAGGAQLP